jgi:hypothetical protein
LDAGRSQNVDALAQEALEVLGELDESKGERIGLYGLTLPSYHRSKVRATPDSPPSQ